MEKKIADIRMQGNEVLVLGNLSFYNVMSVYEKSLSQLDACPELNFNFSELQSSDSSGLALIMEWIRLAKQRNKPIRFSHLSDDLLSIASVSGLIKLIPKAETKA